MDLKQATALIASMVLASTHVAAQTPDPSTRKEGPLEVHLILTDKGQEILEAWAQGVTQLSIKSIETVRRGEFITAIVLFSGCAADPGGLCNATVDYVAKKPDGSVYGEAKGVELWVSKPAPSSGSSQLSAEYLGLIIDPWDPSGKYSVVATVHDKNGKRTVSVNRPFTVPE